MCLRVSVLDPTIWVIFTIQLNVASSVDYDLWRIERRIKFINHVTKRIPHAQHK